MSILLDASRQIKSGDKTSANALLTRHLNVRPNDEQAWFLLSFCVDSKERQLSYLNKVLAINPNNPYANQALVKLKTRKVKRKIIRPKLLRVTALLMFGLVFPMASVAGIGFVFQQELLTALTPRAPQVTQVQSSQNEQEINSLVNLNQDPNEEYFIEEVDQQIQNAEEQITDTLALPSIPAAYCVPADAPLEEAKVISVPDSTSLQVEIGGKSVLVRYLGIEAPAFDQSLGQYALEVNQTLQGRTVLLASEGANENEAGELIRYVFSGDYFVNYQLVEMGLALAQKESVGLACDGFFLAAEAMAKEQEVGLWEWIDVRMDPNQWETWPVVPLISKHAKEVYLASIASGHAPGNFSVLGDCQAPQWRLFGQFDSYSLVLSEDLVYLKDTVAKYTGQWNRDSITVKSGNTVASLYSVYWADPALCGPAESPIECELRVNNPSFVFIMLGTNWGVGKEAEFDRRMRETVEYLLTRNILPIIMNKADANNPYVLEFPLNRIMAQIAYDYDIPLWNFWASVQHLYNGGIDPYDPYMIHLIDEAFQIKRWSGLQTLDALNKGVYGD